MEFDIRRLESVDVLKLKSYVNKVVQIEIVSGKSFQGILFTVDPISECAVLLCLENGKEIPMFFAKHSIKEITVIDSRDAPATKTEMSLNLLKSGSVEMSEDEKNKRRSILKEYFLKAYVPIVEDGDQLIMEKPRVVINPPYQLTDILTDNIQVLNGVQNVMKQIYENINLDKLKLEVSEVDGTRPILDKFPIDQSSSSSS